MTSKRRALNYIRQKNHLSVGQTMKRSFKIAPELKMDEDFIIKMLNSEIHELESKYKMPLEVRHIKTGYCADDFIRCLYTVLFEFGKVK